MGQQADPDIRASRAPGVLAIADRILELSSYDAIQFDYVATVILEDFTDMTRADIVVWVQNQHVKWRILAKRAK